MKTIINTLTSLDITLNDREKEALSIVNEIITNINVSMHSAECMVSTTTGEVITQDELPRVLGILDGIKNNSSWIYNERP